MNALTARLVTTAIAISSACHGVATVKSATMIIVNGMENVRVLLVYPVKNASMESVSLSLQHALMCVLPVTTATIPLASNV